ncbi:hypothetical protein [Oscillibacter sp.]|uniref:hypothetical protein n=1 Tax=Oscillibacter sp. TaxID=1945593 RepID=UPI00289FEFCB|nr:hypothetical protein [Oscillibacter sp.]
MSELKPCPMAADEAIDLLQNSNAMLKSRIEEILALANDPTIIIPYDDIDYCKREYEAVELAVAELRRAQPSNEPLTLDELRGMDGEPVWLKDGIGEGWFLVSAVVGSKICFYEKSITVGEPLSACGQTWLAYRHKPERSENDG